MINIYNIAYMLKEKDVNFNLKALLNGTCYLDDLLDEDFLDVNDKELFSDIYNGQFSFRYLLNNSGEYDTFHNIKNKLTIDRNNKKEADLSRIRSTLINEVEKNLKERLLFSNKELSDDIRIFDKKIVVEKYSRELDIFSMLNENEQKTHYLYTFKINNRNKEIDLIFKVLNEFVILSITEDEFLENLEKYYRMLGFGINNETFKKILEKSTKTNKILNLKGNYIKNLSDARNKFIRDVKNKYKIFLLRNGKKLDLPLDMYFLNIPNYVVINFLNKNTNEHISIIDVENYLS